MHEVNCQACLYQVCVLCQKLNQIKNEGKPYKSDEPYNTHHCKEHCEHKNESHLIPEVHLVDERWKMR